MRKNKEIVIKQDPENEIPAEVLADAILEMSKAAKKLANCRLNRNAVVTLIKDQTGETKLSINRVLDSLNNLERDWIKK